MKKLIISTLCFLTSIQFSFSQSNIEKLLDKTAEEYSQNPAATIQKYGSDDFTFINAEGNILNKTQTVQVASAGKLEDVKFTDRNIKTYGNITIVKGINTSRWNIRGMTINYKDAFTYIYQINGNDVKWLSAQHSLVTLKDRNKAIFRELEQLGNEQKPIDYSKFYADSFEIKDVGKGPSAAEKVRNLARKGFPDLNVRIIELIAEGDLLFARCESTGTHLGDYYGNKATGKSGKIAHWVVYRFNSEGKIVQSWTLNDNLLLMQQLGIIK